MKKQQKLSLVIILTMLLSAINPVGLPVYADTAIISSTDHTFNINYGNITITAGTGDQSNMIAVTHGSTSVTDYVYANDTITITGTTTATANRVVVDGVKANITLQNVNIESMDAAIELRNNAEVTLTLLGTNILRSGSNKAGLQVPSGNTITINGTGSLNATGGVNGAGIGGGWSGAGGTININGGTVTASGDNGAGIGGGWNGAGGTITINAGIVDATGGWFGAGIGGGEGRAGGTITISGGTITATSRHGGAGIGGGDGGAGGTITISNNPTVIATMGTDAPNDIGNGGGSDGDTTLKNSSGDDLSYIRLEIKNNSLVIPNTTVTANANNYAVNNQGLTGFFMIRGDEPKVIGVNSSDINVDATITITDNAQSIRRDINLAYHNNNLSSIILSSGTLSPAFSSEETSYTASVANSVSTITVTPTVVEANATIKVNGLPVPNGVASSPIALIVGSNSISVEVTAQDGLSIKTYSINVTRASAPTGSGGGGGGGTPESAPAPTPVITEPRIDIYIVQEDLLDRQTMIREDGQAVEIFTVKEGLKEEIVKAKAQGASAVKINIPDNEDLSATINVTADVFNTMVGMDVIITTPNASLKLPKALVEALALAGQGLSLTIERGDRTVVESQLRGFSSSHNAQVIGTPTVIKTAIRGNTIVTLPLTGIVLPSNLEERNNLLESLAVFVVHSDGERKIVKGEIVYDTLGNPEGISIMVNRFSTFTIIKLSEKPLVELSDISGHWAEGNIKELVARGAIMGYPDGTFKPNNSITRGEFVAILVKAFNLEEATGKVFADTAEHWAKEYISTAAANGIVTGYDETTFGPNDLITREQMAAMVIRAAKLDLRSGKISFSDTKDISNWALSAVHTAYYKGIITGYTDNTFKPKGNATRAEAATVIIRALE